MNHSAITDWMTAVGTCGAVIFSVRQANKLRKAELNREIRSQAEKVTCWLPSQDGGITFNLTVFNSSNQVIYNLIANPIIHTESNRHYLNIKDTPQFCTLIGTVPPGQYTFQIKYPGRGMSKRLCAEISFNDSSNRSWIRYGNGVLEETKKSPTDIYKIDLPASWLSP